MKSLEESVVFAMDGSNRELYEFLPYIMQDLWEIGSDPAVILSLIEEHRDKTQPHSVLDLGCGKGVVSVKIAKKLGFFCHGIDGVPGFVDFAEMKAKEYGVSGLCKFEVGDIRERIRSLPAYDIIILGSIGPVLGDFFSTLTALSKCLKKNGIVILDEGFLKDDTNYTHALIRTRKEMISQFTSAGMTLAGQHVIQPIQLKKSNDYIFAKIETRCRELIKKYPEKKSVFLDYINRQKEENQLLETELVCATMVIRRADSITDKE
jgi:2-polyprenyl-3-methyl-5-hydroxy-6-metoxy-1,4-benzoquinol methylase